MPDWINTEQVNKLVQRLLPYLMQSNLMKQRQAGSQQLLENRMMGYAGLEEQRQGNRMEEMMEDYINQVSVLPDVKRLKAMISQGRERGLDTSQYEAELSTYIDDVGAAALSMASGQPADEATARTIARFTPTVMAALVGGQRDIEKQRRQIEEVAVPGLKLEKKRLGVRQEELDFKWADMNTATIKDRKDEWISLIRDTESFLESEGVKREKVTQFTMSLLAGKELDPLSPEDRGKAFSWLTNIRINLTKGKMPSPEDERFLRRVKNSFAVEKGGGHPSPATGITPVEEADITGKTDVLVKQRLLEMLTQLYMQEGGLKEETAREMAQKLLGQLR